MPAEPLTAEDLYLDPPDDADGDPVFPSVLCFPDEPVGGDPFAVAELSRGLTVDEAEGTVSR